LTHNRDSSLEPGWAALSAKGGAVVRARRADGVRKAQQPGTVQPLSAGVSARLCPQHAPEVDDVGTAPIRWRRGGFKVLPDNSLLSVKTASCLEHPS